MSDRFFNNLAQVLPADCPRKELKANCVSALYGTAQYNDESKARDQDAYLESSSIAQLTWPRYDPKLDHNDSN